MATLSLRLPESLHRKLVEVAKAEGISLNQLIATAAAEKLSALTTEEYLAQRAERGSQRGFALRSLQCPMLLRWMVTSYRENTRNVDGRTLADRPTNPGPRGCWARVPPAG